MWSFGAHFCEWHHLKEDSNHLSKVLSHPVSLTTVPICTNLRVVISSFWPQYSTFHHSSLHYSSFHHLFIITRHKKYQNSKNPQKYQILEKNQLKIIKSNNSKNFFLYIQSYHSWLLLLVWLLLGNLLLRNWHWC